MHVITFITRIIVMAFIGVLPFGLVNLSVIHTALFNKRQIALLAGSNMAKAIGNNPLLKYAAVFIALVVGLFFVFKNDNQPNVPDNRQGIVLNLLSVQRKHSCIAAVNRLKTNKLHKITPRVVMVFTASG